MTLELIEMAIKESMFEIGVVVSIGLAVVLAGLVISVIQDAKAEEREIKRERRIERHQHFEQEAKDMQDVYDSIRGGKDES